MLQLLYLNKSRFKEFRDKTLIDPYYKYYYVQGWINYKIDDSNWTAEDYASIDPEEGKLLGIFVIKLDRITNSVSELGLMKEKNLTDRQQKIFTRDLLSFFRKTSKIYDISNVCSSLRRI